MHAAVYRCLLLAALVAAETSLPAQQREIERIGKTFHLVFHADGFEPQLAETIADQASAALDVLGKVLQKSLGVRPREAFVLELIACCSAAPTTNLEGKK